MPTRKPIKLKLEEMPPEFSLDHGLKSLFPIHVRLEHIAFEEEPIKEIGKDAIEQIANIIRVPSKQLKTFSQMLRCILLNHCAHILSSISAPARAKKAQKLQKVLQQAYNLQCSIAKLDEESRIRLAAALHIEFTDPYFSNFYPKNPEQCWNSLVLLAKAARLCTINFNTMHQKKKIKKGECVIEENGSYYLQGESDHSAFLLNSEVLDKKLGKKSIIPIGTGKTLPLSAGRANTGKPLKINALLMQKVAEKMGYDYYTSKINQGLKADTDVNRLVFEIDEIQFKYTGKHLTYYRSDAIKEKGRIDGVVLLTHVFRILYSAENVGVLETYATEKLRKLSKIRKEIKQENKLGVRSVYELVKRTSKYFIPAKSSDFDMD